MDIPRIQSYLWDACAKPTKQAYNKEIKKLLKRNPGVLDMLYDDGMYFLCAVSKNNHVLVKALLEYYKNSKLNRDPETYEHKFAKLKIIDAIQSCLNAFNISDEMKEVLQPYMVEEEFTDLENDLEEFEELLFFDVYDAF